MICQEVRSQLDLFSDGMLPDEATAEVRQHLAGCAGCASEALAREQLRRRVGVAGRRYTAPAELRARLRGTSLPKRAWGGWYAVAAAAACLVVALALWMAHAARQRDAARELVDLHITTLAGASPVDVVSSDRHTVKPWFQGKLPFTFDPPEVAGTPYTLLGGRLVYVEGQPAALLLYRVRLHHISVIITRGPHLPGTAALEGFHLISWHAGGLDFCAVTDAAPADLDGLRRLYLGATGPG